MEAYTGLAGVYDIFMDNTPYKDWSTYVIQLLNQYGIKDGILLELGCGTGTVTELLAEEGYDMIGLDCASDMLEAAYKKRELSGHSILYLHQDMRAFELYGTVRAVISICDSLNYILEYNELVKVFKLVNNYLDPGGLFIFDLNTIHKYEQIGDSVIAENRETCSFIWENVFYEQELINEYHLTVFVKDHKGKYDKIEEMHYQRAYRIDEIKKAVHEAGMELLEVYNAMTFDEPSEDSDRYYFIAKESGKV